MNNLLNGTSFLLDYCPRCYDKQSSEKSEGIPCWSSNDKGEVWKICKSSK